MDASPQVAATPDSAPGGLTVSAGMQVPLFHAGKGSPSTWSAQDMNIYAKLCNAFANLQVLINTGQTDDNGNPIPSKADFKISDLNAILDLTPLLAAAQGGSEIFLAQLTASDTGGTTLACSIDGSAETVLKPLELQGTFSGTGSGIYLPYTNTDWILTAYNEDGWGAEDSASTGALYLDLNLAARQLWTQAQYCISGVTKYVLLRAVPQTGAFFT